MRLWKSGGRGIVAVIVASCRRIVFLRERIAARRSDRAPGRPSACAPPLSATGRRVRTAMVANRGRRVLRGRPRFRRTERSGAECRSHLPNRCRHAAPAKDALEGATPSPETPMFRLVLLLAALVALPAHAFDLQGHRGARGLVPENTLPAFQKALDLGVDTIECDMAITKDGVVVIHHDLRLNPDTTRGPDGKWLDKPGPGHQRADLRRTAALRRRAAQARHRLREGLSRPAAGRRHADSPPVRPLRPREEVRQRQDRLRLRDQDLAAGARRDAAARGVRPPRDRRDPQGRDGAARS